MQQPHPLQTRRQRRDASIAARGAEFVKLKYEKNTMHRETLESAFDLLLFQGTGLQFIFQILSGEPIDAFGIHHFALELFLFSKGFQYFGINEDQLEQLPNLPATLHLFSSADILNHHQNDQNNLSKFLTSAWFMIHILPSLEAIPAEGPFEAFTPPMNARTNLFRQYRGYCTGGSPDIRCQAAWITAPFIKLMGIEYLDRIVNEFGRLLRDKSQMVKATALFNVPYVLREINILVDENANGNIEQTEELKLRLVDEFIKRYRELGDLQAIQRDGRIVLRTMEQLVPDRRDELIALAGEANNLNDVPVLPSTMIDAVHTWLRGDEATRNDLFTVAAWKAHESIISVRRRVVEGNQEASVIVKVIESGNSWEWEATREETVSLLGQFKIFGWSGPFLQDQTYHRGTHELVLGDAQQVFQQ